MSGSSRVFLALGLVAVTVACGEWPGNSLTGPTATTTSGTPPTTTPATSGVATVGWTEDISPILSADCTHCHSQLRTYAGTMSVVTPGNGSSRLVTVTRSNGSMYRYLSGDRAGKAELIRRWVVDNGAAQHR